MHKKHFSLGRARVAALVVAVASAIALGAPALARADAVTTWNTYATGALIGTAASLRPWLRSIWRWCRARSTTP